MNEPTTPLASDVVDELLSAELDGEFDRAAEDLGLDPEVARARLAVTPGVVARRAALLQARTVIAAAPEMDELLEQRLVSKALRTSEQAVATQGHAVAERRRRLWLATGGIAAAVLLVVGLVVALNGSGRSDNDQSAGGALREGTPESAADTPVPTSGSDAAADAATSDVNLGDVSDPSALRQKVLDALAVDAQRRAASGGANASTTAPPALRAPTKGPLDGNETFTSAVPTPTTCRDAIAAIAPDAAPLLVGQGTVANQPVGVFVFVQPEGGRFVLVMTPDCRVLNQQFLR
jgi:hypothetical protein